MAQDTTVIRRFQFSTTEALSIEIGHYYMRFYKDAAIITVTGTDDPYILETVYPASAVRDLYLKQVNDVTFICHPDYPPFQLLRYADNSWALEEIDWTYPPFLSQNADDTITITPSGTTGSIVAAKGNTQHPTGSLISALLDADARLSVMNGDTLYVGLDKDNVPKGYIYASDAHIPWLYITKIIIDGGSPYTVAWKQVNLAAGGTAWALCQA